MRHRLPPWLGPALLAAVAAALVLAPARCAREPAPLAPTPAPPARVESAPEAPRIDRPALRPVAAAPGHPRSPLADGLNSPGTTARDDLHALERILGLYRERFGAYPAFEDNAQLVNALAGANPARLGLLPRDTPAVDSPSGAVLDRWGSPYAFHALSRHALEIRTAGPDRAFHTDDDLVTRLGAPDDSAAGRDGRVPFRSDRPR